LKIFFYYFEDLEDEAEDESESEPDPEEDEAFELVAVLADEV